MSFGRCSSEYGRSNQPLPLSTKKKEKERDGVCPPRCGLRGSMLTSLRSLPVI